MQNYIGGVGMKKTLNTKKMIILRQKEFNDKPPRKKIPSITDPVYRFLNKKHIEAREGSGNEDLSQKVIGEFKKVPNSKNVVNDIRVDPSKIELGDESFSGCISMRQRDRIKRAIKRNKKVIIELNNKRVDFNPEWLKDPDFLAGRVNLNNLKDTPVLAHELGHAERAARGSLFHDLQDKLRKSKLQKNAGAIGLASGFASGYNQTKNDDDSTIRKAEAYIPAVAINAPVLIEEADASRRGLRLMKNAGASKTQLRRGRKSLAYAFGTYAIRPAAQIAMTGVGRVAGKVAGRLSKNKENKK